MGYNNGLVGYRSERGVSAEDVLTVLSSQCEEAQRGLLVAHAHSVDLSPVFLGELPSVGLLSFPGEMGMNPDALAWHLSRAGATALALSKSDFYQFAAWQIHSPRGSFGRAASTLDYSELSLHGMEALVGQKLRFRARASRPVFGESVRQTKDQMAVFLDEMLGQFAADQGRVLRFGDGWEVVPGGDSLPWTSWVSFSSMSWPANLRTLKAMREAQKREAK